MFTARYGLNSTFCPHSVFMCFVWIWEQTAIISLYSIDWLVFITETECLYCAVRSSFYVLPTQCIYVFCVDLGTNSDYFTVQHWVVGFYNWDGVCLLRGTVWVFIYNSVTPISLAALLASCPTRWKHISQYKINWLVFLKGADYVLFEELTKPLYHAISCLLLIEEAWDRSLSNHCGILRWKKFVGG